MTKITTTHTMVGELPGPTVAEIKRFIAGLPDDARISLAVTRADQREAGSWTMTSSAAPTSSVGWSGPTYGPGER